MGADGLKKLYYSIREVSEMTGVESHVLRFWEKEFSLLRPRRGRSGNRTYKERDIKIILAIKDLLYKQKYTTQGAVEQLKQNKDIWEKQTLEDALMASKSGVAQLREMLLELRDLVAR
ncbi:MAG: MerR family transcriptional regulator [Candidatus Latescibacteria bacterium]|jgi:DNA-binding transcriptional MerR regulator|nr:MerR family transcriptional regulator [Candidatus Latescibacterota bacterium]MBT4141445.1 MerR family transcriptional regulator [Candidatus Latescibacterota bacterium]MBT5831935.1 MerR family transcriptional regulator [Candidatus Latescibacterota bacterium]